MARTTKETDNPPIQKYIFKEKVMLSTSLYPSKENIKTYEKKNWIILLNKNLLKQYIKVIKRP